jgi:AAA+ superfamily predicted ATPase
MTAQAGATAHADTTARAGTTAPAATMAAAGAITWTEANQRYLAAHLGRVRGALERHAGTASEMTPDAAPVMEHDHPAALETLCQLFDLSPFERDVLLLCAGVELEATFAPLCAAAQGDPGRDYPTFSLALAALPGAHWSALSPAAPLRYWQLVRVEPGRALTRSLLRIDERVLHYLAGVQHLDEGLAGLLRPLRAAGGLAPSQQTLAIEIAATWAQAADVGELPAIQLCGPQVEGKRAVAAAACAALGLDVYLLPLVALPANPGEIDRLLRRWQREAALGGGALLIDGDGIEGPDAVRDSALARLVEGSRGPTFVSGRERRGPWQRPTLTYDVGKPSHDEQHALWQAALGADAERLDGQVARIVAQFDLSPATIAAAAQGARGRLARRAGGPAPRAEPSGAVLWDVCRLQARPQLDDLAQRIAPAATWDDLVLPEEQKALLREIGVHVRQRTRVYETWGFAQKGQRGLGISALFSGPSGTGKTMAAEVLARELRLDLYRIDLSAVVSKYIGETEKNLRRVFDAAEAGGAILLFDEADALFGRRSEVKDSHDRHANIEVSYLLQRMEAYRGLAILTSNLKDSLDAAFVRRIRFIVSFPFPDPAQREAIWRRIYPAATPTEGLDAAKLAQLNVAGGNIRNIALNAAFLAADAGQPVRMAHLLRAARREYAKLEKALTGGETRGWEESER